MLESVLIVAYTLLIVAMGATVYVQKTRERAVIAFIFTFTILVFDLVSTLTDYPEFYYYIAGGIIDLCVILILSNLVASCRLSDDLLKILLTSIAYNLIGFYMFNEGYENTVFRFMGLSLYAWAFYVLIRGEPSDARVYKGDSWLYSLRFTASTRDFFNTTKQETK